jgi:hypothetical protein
MLIAEGSLSLRFFVDRGGYPLSGETVGGSALTPILFTLLVETFEDGFRWGG